MSKNRASRTNVVSAAAALIAAGATEATSPVTSSESAAPESTDIVLLPSETAGAVVTAESLLSTKPKSIRALVMSGLLANVDRDAIAAAIVAHFPTSQAAAKSSIHISWYAGKMRKSGLDVPKVAARPRATTVTVSEQAVAA